VCTKDRLEIRNLRCEDVGKINFDEKIEEMKSCGNFYVLRLNRKVLFYDMENGKISREFVTDENIISYSISCDVRWLGIGCENVVYVFDVLTGALLEKIECSIKNIEFSPNLDFLVISSSLSPSLNLYYNNSNFSEHLLAKKRIEFEYKGEERNDILKINKNSVIYKSMMNFGERCEEENNFYIENIADENARDLMGGDVIENIRNSPAANLDDVISRMEKSDVLRVINEMSGRIRMDFDLIQGVLYRILKYHSDKIEIEDIEEFYGIFCGEWNVFENNCLKTISYLEFEKKRTFE
jgi:WD40 repeat protein